MQEWVVLFCAGTIGNVFGTIVPKKQDSGLAKSCGVVVCMSNVEIGERIQMIRENRKLTRDELADLVGLSPKFIYEIELGKKGFSARNLIKLSQALSVSCEFIMLGSGSDTRRKSLAAVLSKFNNSELNKLDILIRSIHENDM